MIKVQEGRGMHKKNVQQEGNFRFENCEAQFMIKKNLHNHKQMCTNEHFLFSMPECPQKKRYITNT